MSAAERSAVRISNAEAHREHRATMSAAERAAARVSNAEAHRERLEAMSPEELEERRFQRATQAAIRDSLLSNEELESRRALRRQQHNELYSIRIESSKRQYYQELISALENDEVPSDIALTSLAETEPFAAMLKFAFASGFNVNTNRIGVNDIAPPWIPDNAAVLADDAVESSQHALPKVVCECTR